MIVTFEWLLSMVAPKLQLILAQICPTVLAATKFFLIMKESIYGKSLSSRWGNDCSRIKFILHIHLPRPIWDNGWQKGWDILTCMVSYHKLKEDTILIKPCYLFKVYVNANEYAYLNGSNYTLNVQKIQFSWSRDINKMILKFLVRISNPFLFSFFLIRFGSSLEPAIKNCTLKRVHTKKTHKLKRKGCPFLGRVCRL